MSGELTALLLKALRSLAPEEQDKVMSELLSARLEWQPGPLAEPVSHAAPPSLGAHMLSELRVSLASESGGPWRTVPVRLPVANTPRRRPLPRRTRPAPRRAEGPALSMRVGRRREWLLGVIPNWGQVCA